VLRGGAGAVELAARLERLAFGSAADSEPASAGPRAEVVAGNSDRVMTVGVNWYLNQWVKVQFNVIRDTLRDPSQGPSPGQQGFWSRVLRFQLSI
jgi:phosphate-selective porin